MAEVALTEVTKIFDKKVVAVDNITLNIKDKEFFVIVGPSGCGKSTVLRLIAGLEDPDRGQIFIDGQIVNDIPPKDRNVAMVFQNYALYPHLTVFDNIAFGLKVRRYPKSEIEKRVTKTAELLGIKEMLSRKPKALSGGQKQRVALGRAIVRNPKVFLFDEPLSNLDAKLRVQMRSELLKLSKSLNTTCIYVTHDQIEALTLGNRIAVMKDGKLLQVADPLTLYQKPINKFVAGFIGSPAMNFIEGIIKSDHGLWFVSSEIKFEIKRDWESKLLPYKEKEVILGIRPEHISLEKENPEDISFWAKVEMAEILGEEKIYYLSLFSQSITAKTLSPKIYRGGDLISIQIPLEKCLFFDKITEERIS